MKYFYIIIFIFFYSCGDRENSQITEYYDNGKIKSKYYLDSKKEVNGEFIAYYPSGMILSKGLVKNNNKIGLWFFYNQEGMIEASGKYNDGKKCGNWDYYDNGKKVQQVNWKESINPGFSIIYPDDWEINKKKHDIPVELLGSEKVPSSTSGFRKNFNVAIDQSVELSRFDNYIQSLFQGKKILILQQGDVEINNCKAKFIEYTTYNSLNDNIYVLQYWIFCKKTYRISCYFINNSNTNAMNRRFFQEIVFSLQVL